jgi:glycosyltransferase involved in cell wall biosynthesis
VEKSQARAALQIPRKAILLVSVAKEGTENPYKDFATLRGALSRLQCGGRQVICAVLGRVAVTETLPNGVILRHERLAPPEEVARWLQAADLCVHSTREEVFGLVLAEALACGTPVVATDVAGIPEVVRHGRVRLLVPPGDPDAFAIAMESLVSDPSRLMQMGRDGTERARVEFDEARMVREYLDWFEQVLAEDPTRHA